MKHTLITQYQDSGEKIYFYAPLPFCKFSLILNRILMEDIYKNSVQTP